MPEAVLGDIDDFFGPLNVETLAQVLDFARYHTITTRGGGNDFVSVGRIKQQWPKAGTLMLGGADNGMVDARQSGVLMSRLLTAAGITTHQTHVVAGAGHQDLLLGLPAQEVFGVINQFLK